MRAEELAVGTINRPLRKSRLFCQSAKMAEGHDNRPLGFGDQLETFMATQVILPALGMAQETGIIVRWLKEEGQEVTKGDPLVEIETDKATVEIEAAASGILTDITGAVGVEIP